jgi:hypothetical protein
MLRARSPLIEAGGSQESVVRGTQRCFNVGRVVIVTIRGISVVVVFAPSRSNGIGPGAAGIRYDGVAGNDLVQSIAEGRAGLAFGSSIVTRRLSRNRPRLQCKQQNDE